MKTSKLQQKLNALQNRLNRYISKSVKASRSMILDLIFSISRLENKIATMKNTASEPKTVADKYLAINGSKITIKTPYNSDFVTDLKEAIFWKERNWNKADKVWEVEKTEVNLTAIIKLINQYFNEETEQIHIKGRVSVTSKRNYQENIEIDGNSLYDLRYGFLRDGQTFKIIKINQDEFLRGDRNHAFTKEFDLIIECRKGANIQATGRGACGSSVERI